MGVERKSRCYSGALGCTLVFDFAFLDSAFSWRDPKPLGGAGAKFSGAWRYLGDIDRGRQQISAH